MDAEAPDSTPQVVSLPEQVAGRIRGEMAVQQRTVTELADFLDLDRKVTLARYRGEKALTLTEVELIANWLHVDVEHLLGVVKAVA